IALADGAAVLDDHGPDERVGARVPARLRGQFNSSEEVALVALCGQRLTQGGPGSFRKLTRESTLPAGGSADANLCRCSMRLRSSSHARVSASVPVVRDDAARAEETAPPPAPEAVE